MDEARRLATLEAMGIQSYVSRAQLPGAALTRRLAVVSKPRPVEEPQPAIAPGTLRPARSPVQSATKPAAVNTPATERPVEKQAPQRFVLGVIVAAQWLWLEELTATQMSPQQLQLVQAMAFSLAADTTGGAAQSRPEVEYFNWPLHTNQQLDLGAEAARSGVTGFIQRRLEQRQCRGLILLGHGCAARVGLEQLACPRVVSTLSTASMLAEPLCKQQAWRELQAAYTSS